MYDEMIDFNEHKFHVATAVRLLTESGFKIPEKSAVLDLGAGQGMHAGFLAENFAKVYCADIIDYSALYEGMFTKLIGEKYQRNGFQIDLQKVAFIQSDAMNLIFRDDLFDCCVTFNAFEHIPNPQLALSEVIRTLKPSGYAFITFDPIWTCDTGSHFFHRVPEPWAHLVLSNEQFHNAMKSNGASVHEQIEFDSAMNRWRLSQFNSAFEAIRDSGVAEVIFEETYSAPASEAHLGHPNFALAIGMGYSKEELLLRNMRWVIKKS